MTLSNDLRFALQDLYAAYAACLDAGRFDDWPEFFTQDCLYRVVPRENFDQALPLSTMELHGKAMLKDRVYGVQSTLFHAPYYQRHLIGPLHFPAQDGDRIIGDRIEVEANYLVVRTKRDLPSELFNAGRYVDQAEITAEGLKFARKVCVFDSELIPNSMIYPI
ncbi:aromatic-ring-hydroxylating dioxygenase subunit beta [soil metagenome]